MLDTALSSPATRWADNALWPLDVTLAFNVARCVPASKPPSIFIRQISQTPGGELCGSSLLCNRSRLHCDTCQSGRKWRSDSLNYLSSKPPIPPSIHPSFCLRSIYYSIFPQRCSGHLPHEGESDGSWDKAAIWQRNSDFVKLKDDSRGQMGGPRNWTAVSKVSSTLI